MVKKYINGAKAPSSPVSCNRYDNISFFQMVDWYYRNEFTISIDCYDIDDRFCVVEITEKIGDVIKTRSNTIGRSTKNLIIDNYRYYHT